MYNSLQAGMNVRLRGLIENSCCCFSRLTHATNNIHKLMSFQNYNLLLFNGFERASPSACWSIVSSSRLSATAFSITTWRNTIYGHDGDIDSLLKCGNPYYQLLSSSSLAVHYLLHCVADVYPIVGERSQQLRVSLSRSVHLQLYASRSSWFKVVEHWSLTSANRRCSDRRKSGFYSSPELRRSSRCRSS